MNKLLTLLCVLILLLAVRLVSAAPADLPRWMKHRHEPTVHIETKEEHLARFQLQLVNALELQPHQLCVLRHTLRAQTNTFILTAESAPVPTLTQALQHLLSPRQLARLAALPTEPAFAGEFAVLGVRP